MASALPKKGKALDRCFVSVDTKVASSTDARAEPGAVRVMSYNILAPSFVNPKFAYCDDVYLSPAYRVPLIIEEVLLAAPDIVGMQEVQLDVFTESLSPALSAAGYQGFFVPMVRTSAVGQATFFRTAAFTARHVIPVALPHLVKGLRAQYAHAVADTAGVTGARLVKTPPAAEVVLQVVASSGNSHKLPSGTVANADSFFAATAPPSTAAAPAEEGAASAAGGSAPKAAFHPSAALAVYAGAPSIDEGVVKAHLPAFFPALAEPVSDEGHAAVAALKPDQQQRVVNLVGAVPRKFDTLNMRGQVALVLVLDPVGGGEPVVITNYHAYWDPRWGDIKALHTQLLLHWLVHVDRFVTSGQVIMPPWGLIDVPFPEATPEAGTAPELSHILVGDLNCKPTITTGDLLAVVKPDLGNRTGLLMLMEPTHTKLGGCGGTTCEIPTQHLHHPARRLPSFPPPMQHKKKTNAANRAIAESIADVAWQLPSLTRRMSLYPMAAPWRWSNAYKAVAGKDMPWSNWHPGFSGNLDYVFTSGPGVRAVAVMGHSALLGGKAKALPAVFESLGATGCPNRLAGSDHIPVAADLVLGEAPAAEASGWA